MSRTQPSAGSDAGAIAGLLVAAALGLGGCGDDGERGGAAGAGAGGAQGGAGTGANGGAPMSSSTGIDLTSSSTGLLPMFEVTGFVVDQDGEPVEGAIVMQGGGEVQMTTGADGAFTIQITNDIVGVPVPVAAKVGYRSAGVELTRVPDEPITLQLVYVKPPDNALGYTFGEPGIGDPVFDNSTAICGHCHTTYAADFQQSAHARATRDPIVQDLYAGVASAIVSEAACASAGGVIRDGATPGAPLTAQPRCYVGDGVLPDLNACGAAIAACDDPALPAGAKPTRFGACADCHAIGMDGLAGGRNLLDAEGTAFEHGNHCDACHHVRDVDLSAPPGNAGRLVMQRPRETVNGKIGGPFLQAMFGPYPDVPNGYMGGSYQPVYDSAELCAGCHEQKQEALLPGSSLAARFASGLPTHSTFSEWQASAFGAGDVPCQTCHMPPVLGLFNSVDVANPDDAGMTGGFERSSSALHSHVFRGPLSEIDGDVPLAKSAVSIQIEAASAAGQLDVDVTLTNAKCGHAIPTGEPMRGMVLLVGVTGCDETFAGSGGMTIPEDAGAKAQGTAGGAISINGVSLTWPDGALVASPGDRVRVVRASGTFWDYDGVGLFEGSTLTAAEKGIAIAEPVGEARVITVAAGIITLDRTIDLQPGDAIYLGDDVDLQSPMPIGDGDASRALAGMPGMYFGKVLLDPDGRRGVPHHRAVDIASDDRIRPLASATTSHRFVIPAGCTSGTIRAIVVYRPLPVSLARERGWDARDAIIEHAELDVSL